MGGIQGDVKKIPMKQYNFSVPASVLEEYRNFCKANGIKMNFPLTIFMQQFSKGHFNFVFQNCEDQMNFLGMEVDGDSLITLSKQSRNQLADKIIVRLEGKTE